MDFLFPIITIAILVFSAILHEIAHGFVAERFGDPTARLAGRLTLNPKKHIDPLMSILLPLMLIISGSPVIFGAAKPVPVDPFNFKDGRKDIALVSLAGPLTNVLIAVLASIIVHTLGAFSTTGIVTDILYLFFLRVVQINILLAVFNLLPIPPLDGSKVFALILPRDIASAYLSLSSIGFFIIFFLLFFPIGGFSLMNIVGTLLTFSLSLLGI
jgi:Zn-dependent protease